MSVRFGALLLMLVACGGGRGGGNDDCAAPDAPSISAPVEGRIVEQEDLAVIATGVPEADGAGAEYEIWTLDGDQADERVWRASIEDAEELGRASLADGAYEGSAEAGGALAAWEQHGVRVRMRTAEECAWSEWSAFRAFRTGDGSETLFDPEAIHEISLEIPQDSWDAIDAQAVGPWPNVPERDYHVGTLRFDDQVFEGVGIRVKGGCGSSRNLTQKAAFKISLSWDDPDVAGCPESRRLFGQTHVTLNNGVQDQSFEHELLGYRVFRDLGVPAPRAAHVRLHVNGEDWGLYLHVESLDRRFLQRWFESKDGMMYEGGPFCDLVPEQIPPGAGEACFDQEFSTDACDAPDADQDPTDWELLRELADQIAALPPGGFYPEVEEFFDYDEFLLSWAVTSVLSNWDGYQYADINNYRVYHDPSTDRWSLLQTGIDNTFGLGFDFWTVTAVLATRCIAEDDCKAAFARRVGDVTDRFERLELAADAEALHDRIAGEIASDPRKEYDVATFEGAHAALLDFIARRPDEVRASLAAQGF